MMCCVANSIASGSQRRSSSFTYNREWLIRLFEGPYRHDEASYQLGEKEHFDDRNSLLGSGSGVCFAQTQSATADFGPSNPFYAPSTLPFQAPPFNKIKDSDYQPAIDAGMAQQIKEVEAIANNPAPPTFENTLVALERAGQLLIARMAGFNCVTGANTDR